MLMCPNRTKQLSMVALVTCIVITRRVTEAVMRMRVGSGKVVRRVENVLHLYYAISIGDVLINATLH